MTSVSRIYSQARQIVKPKKCLIRDGIVMGCRPVDDYMHTTLVENALICCGSLVVPRRRINPLPHFSLMKVMVDVAAGITAVATGV